MARYRFKTSALIDSRTVVSALTVLTLLMSIRIEGTAFEDIQKTIDRVANHTDELITDIRVTLNGTTVVVSQLGDAVTVLLDQMYKLIFWTLLILIPVICIAIIMCSLSCLVRSLRRQVRYIPHYQEIPITREPYSDTKRLGSVDDVI